jgi:hypothetical protein
MNLFVGDANGQGGTPNVPFHETLHLFGLSDRYHETRSMPDGRIRSGRGRTVPMRNLWTVNDMQDNDEGYDWRTNAMSSSGLSLTQRQLEIMRDRNTKEQTYKTALLLNPSSMITNGDFFPTRSGGVMFQAFSDFNTGLGGMTGAGFRVSSNGAYIRNGRITHFGSIIYADGAGDSNRQIITSVVR